MLYAIQSISALGQERQHSGGAEHVCFSPKSGEKADLADQQLRAITGSLARHDPAADACELGKVP
jgi:hypothetical protein